MRNATTWPLAKRATVVGSIRARHRKLWIRYKDADGERQERPTPFLVNRDETLAQQLLDDTEANVADQVRAKARAGGGPLTLRAYGRAWSERRIVKSQTGDRHASAKDEKAALENYVYGMRLDDGVPLGDLLVKDVRTPHIRQLVEKLEQRDSRKGGKLSPRTVCNAHGVLHTLFEHARADQLVMSNPCDLPVGVLPERDDKDPAWRSTAIFSRAEVETLISDPVIPLDRRAMNGVLFIAGTRWGEMAAFQWRDYDPAMKPLGRLDLNKSYSQRLKRVKSTKTGKQRLIPVHPTLAKLLAEWKLSGWPAMFGRAPGPDDLIFPNAPVLLHSSGAPLAPLVQVAELERARTLAPTAIERYRLPQLGLKRFHVDCDEVGLRRRRNHDARRTTNSLLIADGARDPVRGFIVWGPGKKVSDVYTTLPWETFCEEMAKLKISLREPQVLELRAVNAPSPFHPPALTAPAVNTLVDRSAQGREASSSAGTGRGTGGGTAGNGSGNGVGRTGFGPVLDVCLDADDIRSAVENHNDYTARPDGAAAVPCAGCPRILGNLSPDQGQVLHDALAVYRAGGPASDLAAAIEEVLGVAPADYERVALADNSTGDES